MHDGRPSHVWDRGVILDGHTSCPGRVLVVALVAAYSQVFALVDIVCIVLMKRQVGRATMYSLCDTKETNACGKAIVFPPW
jgi:hypothetical protein